MWEDTKILEFCDLLYPLNDLFPNSCKFYIKYLFWHLVV